MLGFLQERVSLASSLSAAAARSPGPAMAAAEAKLSGKSLFLIFCVLFRSGFVVGLWEQKIDCCMILLKKVSFYCDDLHLIASLIC